MDRFSSSHASQSFFIPTWRVSERKSGNVSIVDVDGPLTVGHAAQAFRERIRELLDEGARTIAVNLGGVGEIDSYGLGGLAAAYNWADEAGATVELFSPQPRVRRMLSRLRLDSVFPIFDTEDDALRASRSAGLPYTVAWRHM